MSVTEAFLVIVIIVLVVYVYSSSGSGESLKPMRKKSHMMMPSIAKGAPAMAMPQSPEAKAIGENAEYFTVCGDSTDVQKELSCYCSDSTGQFANDAFGGPCLSFDDYVKAQGVDDQVVANHAEFVKDRSQGGSVNWTGRTYALPDEIETEFMPNAWVGIRGRPQAVPICNPTQVTDPTSRQFSEKQKLTWSST